MLKWFQYNWQVREDWFDWCEDVPEDELLKKRTGGPGSILFTLLHIVDVEFSWISGLKGTSVNDEPPFEEYSTLHKVRDLSKEYHKTVEPFVLSWTDEMENRIYTNDWDGTEVKFKYGEVMRHALAHEIHHIGQLSIWSRELGRKPVTANLIERGLFD